MSVLLEAIEVIAEDLSAHLGSLKTEPVDDDIDDSVDLWLYNGGLFADLLDLADVANRAAAIVDRPRVREYLASVDFPQSQRLAGLFSAVAATRPRPEPQVDAVAPALVPARRPARDNALAAALAATGLNNVPRSQQTLRVLASAPDDVTGPWLGERIDLHGSAALRILRRLAQRQLVEMVRPTNSRGPATYRITPQLRAVLALIAQGVTQ